ncbi:unnamed protein product [Adineta steineri]|uniref:Apple domain-containing protein n=1 Tax=Adineta steineri TaxID=433720 RepID=A0A819H0N0_9BILA|nr:unnamed protein product [Adineta steineri]CAF3890236.1 unnamed protein product [Adineta steineri]
MYTNYILFLINIHILYANDASLTHLYGSGTDFIPANPIELRGIYSPVASTYRCLLLCHQDPQCRTFVFDLSICQLYEGSSNTGLIINSFSTSRIVGELIYDNINLALTYNQSCNHCYPDRYLVCRNNTCQCPINTYWDDKSKCVNQLFVDSTLACQYDNWCRQDMNLTCHYGKCQCPVTTYWSNKTCAPQLLAGAPCNTSDQCRNDLSLVCSRINMTCISMSIVKMSVINGTLPGNFSQLGIQLNVTGGEWFCAFDNNIYTFWNSNSYNVSDYMLITFNDTYLLHSLQLTVFGDGTHDPKAIDVYLDKEATYLVQSFTYPLITNQSYLTFAPSQFNNTIKPLVARELMINFERFTINQVWLFELSFFGSLY